MPAEEAAARWRLPAGFKVQVFAAEPDIVQHMNEDHADALDLYAGALLGLPGEGWRMTGVDPLGCDLRRSDQVGRLDFARRVDTPEEARAELVRLVHEARQGGAVRPT